MVCVCVFPSDVVDSMQTMICLSREAQPLKDLVGIVCMHVHVLVRVCVPSVVDHTRGGHLRPGS